MKSTKSTKGLKVESEQAENVPEPMASAPKGFNKGLVFGLGGALVLVLIILGVIFGGPMLSSKKITNNQNSTTDQAKNADAAKLRFTIITAKECPNCFDFGAMIKDISDKLPSVNVVGQETLYLTDDAAKPLIEKYKITKVPTVLIAGDLDKATDLQNLFTQGGEIIDGVFVFRQVIPPYIDVASGVVKGKINLVYLVDESCKDCYDVHLHDQALENPTILVRPDEKKTVDISSDEGKDLINKYSIVKVPTIILTGEISEYNSLKQLAPTYFTALENDTVYVFINMDVMGNYKDLKTKKVVEVKLPTSTDQPAQ